MNTPRDQFSKAFDEQIEEMKREHDALIVKGRPLMDELEAMTARVNQIRAFIQEADPDEYDGVRLIFAGTFYD